MADFRYVVCDVFTDTPLEGNQLAVFTDARGLGGETMQALAREINFSEVTFVLPAEAGGHAKIRIFTPVKEMPFAGHPTLGSAHVVRDVLQAGDAVTLEMKAGVIPVKASGDVWTLSANAPKHRAPAAGSADFAAMLGLSVADVASPPLWVDTGSEQLIIPLATFDAVKRAAPTSEGLLKHGSNGQRAMAYVFAREGDRVLARFFFPKHGSVVEDPGTGSACANLGGWLLATGAPLPQRLAIAQGEAVGRPCHLGLEVTTDRQIRVSGRVIEIAQGTVTL